MYAIENQLNQLLTSGFIENRAYSPRRTARHFGHDDRQTQMYPKKASEVFMSTESDLLNTNLIVFCRFKKSLPINQAKSQKPYITAY